MTTIVTILTDGYADWETALLNAVARGYYGVDTRFATPGGRPVTSAGGLSIVPDLAIEAIDPKAIDALVVNGGTAWSKPDAPDIGPTLTACQDAGTIVAGICDGTLALARTGLLDTIAHTANGPGTLDASGYAGAQHYRDVPTAVRSDRIITAPGTAPVSFMVEVLDSLGRRDADLDFYVGLHRAEHLAPAATAA